MSQQLVDGLAQMNLQLSTEPFLDYLALLQKWNQSYNLTAIRDFEAMIKLHILDSLAILPWIKAKRVLDVGTGPGLPGIPLAIANPQMQFTLLDSNGKKIRFLHEVQRHLKLTNVELIQSRVETYRPSLGFDTLTSRAFSSLTQMIQWTEHLIAPQGIWLAMKGQTPEAELEKVCFPYQIHSYKVPGVQALRCCVLIENAIKE